MDSWDVWLENGVSELGRSKLRRYLHPASVSAVSPVEVRDCSLRTPRFRRRPAPSSSPHKVSPSSLTGLGLCTSGSAGHSLLECLARGAWCLRGHPQHLWPPRISSSPHFPACSTCPAKSLYWCSLFSPTVVQQTLKLFSSNDYLGLSMHPDVRRAAAECAERDGLGVRSSPLVAGKGQYRALIPTTACSWRSHCPSILGGW